MPAGTCVENRKGARTNRPGRIAAVCMVLAGVATAAAAQDAPQPSRVWLAAGLGFGHDHNVDANGAALLEIAYQKGSHQLTLRAAGIADPFGAHGELAGDVGFLYGWSRAGPRGHVSVSAGLSGVGFDSCESSQDACFTVGVPVVAEVARRVSPVLGIGAQAFTNLNGESTYGGVAIFVQLGALR